MPGRKRTRTEYLLATRERIGLKPHEVRRRLRAAGLPEKSDLFTKWERGIRPCPLPVLWELARIYDVPFVHMLWRVELGEFPPGTGGCTESPAELTNPRPSPSPAHVSSAEEEETPMTERDRLAAAVNAATQLLGDEVGPVVELILHIRKRAHMPQEGAVPPASAEDGSTV